MLFTEFGPIYSGCWGHHLWVRYEGKPYTYMDTPLPPFCHLLMDEVSLFQHCRNVLGHSSELANRIVEFVFHSNQQNRLFFEDYQRIARDSPLELLNFIGLSDLPYKKEYRPDSYSKIFSKLRAKYPSNISFAYNAISMILRKPVKDHETTRFNNNFQP